MGRADLMPLVRGVGTVLKDHPLVIRRAVLAVVDRVAETDDFRSRKWVALLVLAKPQHPKVELAGVGVAVMAAQQLVGVADALVWGGAVPQHMRRRTADIDPHILNPG